MPKGNWKKDETKIFVIQMAGIFLITITVISIINTLFFEKKSSGDYVETTTPSTIQNQSSENSVNRDREDGVEREVTTVTKPTRITIDSIGVDAKILQPSSPRVDVLDSALKEGAVYYPGSGTIEQGNIFVFGHSTNWAVVQNQAYKTFNDLDKLNNGDEVELQANGKTYVYTVDKVSLVDSNTAFVNLSNTGRRLTISTCDTFGKKADRWVVEASFSRVKN